MIMSRWKWKRWFKVDETGVTLVELMIAVVISGLVMVAVATVYQIQSKSYSVQDDVANMQQELRGALAILPMEIRLAGCDPTESGVPKILEATRDRFRFTMDTKGSLPNPNSADGLIAADEDISYRLNGDSNADGIVDTGGVPWLWNGTPALGRQIGNGGGHLPLADNIEALEFNYILEDGTSTNGSGIATATQPNLAIASLNTIRAVQVSLLARAANPSQGFLRPRDSITGLPVTYNTASGVFWNPPDDNFRRRLVVTNIQCRNMGY